MSTYEVEYEGVKVKTNVVDRAALVDTYIAELRSQFETRVVGLDVKIKEPDNPYYSASRPALLLLYAGTRCLIIQLRHLDSFPDSLREFLADDTICFVGTGMDRKLETLNCKSAVELDHLAARVFKEPNLGGCGLQELARKAEINIEVPTAATGISPHWTATVFSDEEIKYAIQDVYIYYAIGNKLLGLL